MKKASAERISPKELLSLVGTTPAETLRTSRQTDLLGALSGRVAPNTYADLGVQYSPLYSRMERQTVGVRYQPDINNRFGTKFEMPVLYYSQLIAVAYGKNGKEEALEADHWG